MDFSVALQAGEIAAAIQTLETAIASIQGAIDRQVVISGQVLTTLPAAEDGSVSEARMFSFPALTPTESAVMFEGAIAIFQGRIDILRGQLSGL